MTTFLNRRRLISGAAAAALVATTGAARAAWQFRVQAQALIGSLSVTVPSIGRTGLSAASSSAPAGNTVSVVNASASVLPVEYTL